MAENANYGHELVVMCDCVVIRAEFTYAGFWVMRLDTNTEVGRFYEGDPREDFENAVAYADSLSSRVQLSPVVGMFWTRVAMSPKGVKR